MGTKGSMAAYTMNNRISSIKPYTFKKAIDKQKVLPLAFETVE